MTPALPPCEVVWVKDADTLTCRGGAVIRIAGVSGLERGNRCNSAPDCARMPYREAKAAATRILLGRTVRFRVLEVQRRAFHGKLSVRFVGENYAVRCALVRSGAVVEWRRYLVRYNLRRCV